MDVRFESRDAFTITGYAVETSPKTNDTDLYALWSEYEDKLASIKKRLYGVLWYTENHSFFYLLGIESSALEGASTRVEIPAARFAVAKVPGDKTAKEAWTEFFEKELPQRGFAPDAEHGKYFECYDESGACELWTPIVPAESSALVSAVKLQEEKLRRAMIMSDAAASDELFSDDLAFVNHFGQLISKEDDLNMQRQGGIKISDIRIVSQSIRDLGGAAVAITETEIAGAIDGVSFYDHIMYTRIWKETDGVWKLIGGQATRIEI